METYKVTSNNCDLQVYANGNKRSKTAIVCLHGGPGSGAKAIMELSAFQTVEKSYFCVYFDQRGSGESFYEITKGIRLEDITHDVFLVVQDIKHRYDVTHIFLWGGSFGGCLAALCMKQFPEELDGFILSSPAITFSRKEALDFYTRMQAPYKNRLKNEELKENINTSPEEFFQNPAVQDIVYSNQNPSNSLKHICAMSSWFFRQDFHHVFQDVKKPVLILQGKDDPICKYQNLEQELQAKKSCYVQYLLFEDCGHAVFEDREKEFVTEIKRFIIEVTGC